MAGKIVICDLDGTLWDSYPCYAATLHRLGICSVAEGLRLLRAGSNLIGLARASNITNARLNKGCCECIDQLQLFPKVRDSLEKLRADGVPLGIVTNLPSWFIAPLLDNLRIGKLFTSTVAAAGKPSPKGLLTALASLNGTAETTSFYVGDTDADAAAAERANIPFIWASYGYGTQPSSDHTRIDRFDQVLDL